MICPKRKYGFTLAEIIVSVGVFSLFTAMLAGVAVQIRPTANNLAQNVQAISTQNQVHLRLLSELEHIVPSSLSVSDSPTVLTFALPEDDGPSDFDGDSRQIVWVHDEKNALLPVIL